MKKTKLFLIAFFRPNLRETMLLFTVSAILICAGFVSGGWLFWISAGVFGCICSDNKNTTSYEMPNIRFGRVEFGSIISWSRVCITAILIASFALASFCLFQKVEEGYWLRFCRHLSLSCFSFGGFFSLCFLDRLMWSSLGVTEKIVSYRVIEKVTVTEFSRQGVLATNLNP